MRLLLAGKWTYPFYEEACAKALAKAGVTVIPFSWASHFRGLSGRAQLKFPFHGPAMRRLNNDLVETVKREGPDCVFVWRGTHILSPTLRKIREQTRALLLSYNNDDPFGPQAHGNAPWHHRFLWRNFLACIPEYDLHFVYRGVNVSEFTQAGAKAARILMSYFVPDIHRPVSLAEEERRRYSCDAVFVGHYEPNRGECIRVLLQAGLHVRVFGAANTWTPAVVERLGPGIGAVRLAEGPEYAKALCGATMCLCFFSRLNRDTYTRRCFEIPACGRLLLSERTADVASLFKEDEEAVFFSSKEELVDKALWLKSHPEEVSGIAAAGTRRVHADGHSVGHRMREVLTAIGDIRGRVTWRPT